jgi:hypothetical protein
MNVKGTSFVTGKATVIQSFGEDRWRAFMGKLAAKDSYFNNMIMPVTLLPVNKYIMFLNELIDEYFNNDEKVYWMFGMVAAKYALSPGGPYKSHLHTNDIKQFVEQDMPQIWSSFFDGGLFSAKFENNVVHLKITGLPVNNVYFEYFIMGYFKQAMKVFGRISVETCVMGFSKDDKDIYYQYELKDSRLPE